MTHGFSNRVWCNTLTTGTGDVTIGTAKSAHCTPAQAGTPDGSTRTWLLEEGNDFEIFRGAYTASGTVVTRGTVLLSQIGGTTGTTKMTLAGTATIREVAAAEDLLSIVDQSDARYALDIAAFGPTDLLISNTDLNNLTKNGLYGGVNLTNSPNGSLTDTFHIRHQTFDPVSGWMVQWGQGINSTAVKTRYRSGFTGTWSAWTDLATASLGYTPVNKAGDTMSGSLTVRDDITGYTFLDLVDGTAAVDSKFARFVTATGITYLQWRTDAGINAIIWEAHHDTGLFKLYGDVIVQDIIVSTDKSILLPNNDSRAWHLDVGGDPIVLANGAYYAPVSGSGMWLVTDFTTGQTALYTMGGAGVTKVSGASYFTAGADGVAGTISVNFNGVDKYFLRNNMGDARTLGIMTFKTRLSP